MYSTNTHSRRKLRGKNWGKAELCLLAVPTCEGVQAVRTSELVGYGGSNRVDKLTFRVYSWVFSGEIESYLVLLNAKSASMA